MTSPVSTLNEMSVPAILDDFEVGDRVFWWQSDFRVLFGNVTKVDESVIILTLDDGQIIDATGGDAKIYDPFNIAGWAKLVDVSRLKIGDTLSTTHDYYTMEPGKREFFTVIDMVPDRQIFLQNTENHAHTATLDGTVVSLDSYLKYWELEG
jgi:hypothetical protein